MPSQTGLWTRLETIPVGWLLFALGMGSDLAVQRAPGGRTEWLGAS